MKLDGFEGGRVKDCSITIGQPTNRLERAGAKKYQEDTEREGEGSKEKNKKMTVRPPPRMKDRRTKRKGEQEFSQIEQFCTN